jgi:phage-related tail fiber protein
MGINRKGSGASAGAIQYWPQVSPPPGWLEANGALLSRTAYAALWAYAQNSGNLAVDDAAWQAGQFSPGDGVDTFRIPDLRSEFIRGYDNGRGVDPGRVFGSAQADQMQQITGSWDSRCNSGGLSKSGAFMQSSGGGRTDASAAGTSTSALIVRFDSADSPGARVGAETRARNVALLPCIKY